MLVLILTVLILACLAVIIYPLVNHRAENHDGTVLDELAEGLRRARDRVYEDVAMFRQEQFLRLSDKNEYSDRLQNARLQAALLLRRQQQVQEMIIGLDQALEVEISQANDNDPDDSPL